MIFGLLKLYDGILKAFRLDIWAVDEYYVQCEAPFFFLGGQELNTRFGQSVNLEDC